MMSLLVISIKKRSFSVSVNLLKRSRSIVTAYPNNDPLGSKVNFGETHIRFS
jgi:hypothetical protein